MNFVKKTWPIFILLGITYLIVYWGFGKLFTQPNEHIFVQVADGIKNYSAAAYYMKYDGGWMTSGTHYPYGEYALYTDGFYLFAWLGNKLNAVFPTVDYGVGMINFSILFSIGFCSLFLFLILKKYRLPNWYAILVALIICFLSPQLQRFSAHYSLSFAFYIPMLWYFIIRLEESKRQWVWALAMVVGISILTFLHPYYLPLGAFFLLAYGGVYFLQHIRSLKNHWKTLAWIFGVGLGVVILIQGIVSFTDPFGDRHTSPFGMFVYTASFESIFLPQFGPVYDFWNYFTIVRPSSHEGMAYVGVLGFLILIYTVIRILIRLWKRDFKRVFLFTRSKQINGLLWGSLILLVLAFALPFLYFEFILDLVPPFKQFRSLGRFAWVFFYVFTVYSAYYLFLVYRSMSIKGNRAIGLSLVLTVLFLWGVESYINFYNISGRLVKTATKNTLFKESNKDYSQFLAKAGYEAKDFQALLAFPYFNNGSEKFYIYRSEEAVYEALKCTYDTGIPIISLLSPRTSLPHTYNLVQLMSDPLIKKEILPDLNELPLLTIVTNEKLKPDENRVLEQSELIFKNKFLKLYKTPISAFQDSIAVVQDWYSQQKEQLIQYPDFATSDSSNLVRLLTFDDKESTVSFMGSGAYEKNTEDEKLVIFDETLSLDTITMMEASIWIYSDHESPSFPSFYYEQYGKDGTKYIHKNFNPKFYTDVYKNWVKATFQFRYDPTNRLYFFFEHENNREHHYIFDNFLLRPLDVDVIQKNPNGATILYNNFEIPIQ